MMLPTIEQLEHKRYLMTAMTRRQFLQLAGKAALGLGVIGAAKGLFELSDYARQHKSTGADIMADWNGKWIWDSGKASPTNFYLYVRKVIDLPAKPGKAIAKVCADSRYKLFVNGKLIGRGPTRSFPEYQHYDEYNLSKELKKGKNVIAALVHHYGKDTFQYVLGCGAFIFDGEYEIGGQKQSIASDTSWKVLPSKAWNSEVHRMSIQQGFPEIFDANKEPIGWLEPGFDDSDWQSATVIGPAGIEPWVRLIPREIPVLPEFQIYPAKMLETGASDLAKSTPPDTNKLNISLMQQSEKVDKGVKGLFTNAGSLVRRPIIDDLLESELMQPNGEPVELMLERCREENSGIKDVTVKPSPDGRDSYVVLDFGKEVMGYVNIKIKSNSGGTMDIGYSEIMQEGRVVANRYDVKYADRAILRPGVMEYETFDKRAFRYMQIDFRDLKGPVVLEAVSVKFSTYPVKWRGSFACSDDKLNKIREISTYTVQLNMEDGYTDCPWRERAQWWGDARIEALINYYTFGDTLLIRQGLNEIARSQRSDGATACFAPGDRETCKPIPAFTLIWIMSLWDYYMFTGDKKEVANLYPNVKMALEKYFLAHMDKKTGLVGDLQDWNFIDWAPMDMRGAGTSLNCFLAAALKSAINMAKLLDKPADAEKYGKKTEKLIADINTHTFDGKKGVYTDCFAEGKMSEKVSEQANSLAVLFDIAPRDKQKAILDYIHNPKNDVVRAGSPYFSFYVLGALWHIGEKKSAIDYIRSRWGEMLDKGATTTWEMWDQRASLCHGWSGGPAMDLPAQILGIRPTAPGFKQFEVAPETFSLKWAEGVVPSVKGDIEVHWKRESGFEMEVTIPKGTQAAVTLPDPVDPKEVKINGQKKMPDGVSLKGMAGGKPVYIVKGPHLAKFHY